MSITSRISSMEEHVTNAYNGLQGLGADLTYVNKNIENISMVLDDIYDSMPQVSGEGTSLTLDDTRVGKIKSTLKGNTSQTGTPTPTSPIPINVVSGDNEINVTGKNLLPNYATTQTINGVTFTINNDKSININGTASAFADLYMFGSSNNTGNYICIPKGTYSINEPSAGWFYIGREKTLGAVVGNTALLNALSSQDCYFYGFFIRVNNGATINNLTLYPQIEKGSTATTYEPYIGTSYPINLGVENLLDLTSLNPNQVGQQVSNIQENSFIMSGTAVWGNEYFFYENTNKNTTYTASCKYLSSLARKSGLSIYGTNETTGENLTTINSLLVDIPANVETPVTNTFNSGNYDYIVFRYWNNATATALSSRVDLYVKEVQLEKGSKANTYTPYGTTPIELCSNQDGTLRDYFLHDKTLDKWYWHREIGKGVYNGSENWSTGNYGTNSYRILLDNPMNITNTTAMISNLFKGVPYTERATAGNNIVYFDSDNAYIRNTSYTSLADFKTMLGANNMTLYYILATPTNTEITYQPLIDQLNLLEKAMSKDGQTNISQVNNDLPFVISASALKKWSE